MANYNKFNTFVRDILKKIHYLITDGSGDTLAVYLSDTTPDASNHSVKTDLAEITQQNGYSGPVALSNQSGSESSGTVTVSADSVTITASGGSVGPFRYVVLMNDTAADDPLIAWWDYGTSITLNDGESFTIKFNNTSSGGTIFTLS